MGRRMPAPPAPAAGARLASAQGDGTGAGAMAERLRGLDGRPESTKGILDVLYASIVAGLAVLATVAYAVQPEADTRLEREALPGRGRRGAQAPAGP